METITIYKAQRLNQRVIHTTDNFITSDMVVKVGENKLTFRKPTLDYRGSTYKFIKSASGKNYTTILCDLPLGIYGFDQIESDEDCRVVYCLEDNELLSIDLNIKVNNPEIVTGG